MTTSRIANLADLDAWIGNVEKISELNSVTSEVDSIEMSFASWAMTTRYWPTQPLDSPRETWSVYLEPMGTCPGPAPGIRRAP